MNFQGINNESIELNIIDNKTSITFDNHASSSLQFVWLKGKNIETIYENAKQPLEDNTILCLTSFDKLDIINLESARVIKFNREFYCVKEHDKEVSCKGLLFYGSNQLPYFKIPETELDKFDTLWKMFQIEMKSKDSLQLEMLQMMLKRFIILSTRIYKSQMNFSKLKVSEVDLVREFHFLVEQHFKTKHSVKEYALLLYKSSKTIGNIFSQVSDKSPLQIIHERIHLEAKRMLRYTDKSIKEIAFELGFEDLQTFSRFFKRIEKLSPTAFKNMPLGKIATS
ncbi:helix-turn-helix domain-containing protein [Corallibacter vietnamensis]|uniref:Helix-turn-helix domain-containing protein n=1 Tax=Corallibacter vietnamensis TaxID=904130 RepID=A0ABP7H976_9FLAO